MERIRRITAHLHPELRVAPVSEISVNEVGACAASEKSLPPKRVLVTGAAGQIGYSLVFNVATGMLLGPKQPVILHLLDIPQMEATLQGVVMELQDIASPILAGTFLCLRSAESRRRCGDIGY